MDKKFFACSLLIIFIPCAFGCAKDYNASFPAMGTLINLRMACTEAQAAQIAEAARGEVKRIESLMSRYDKASDVYKLNASSGVLTMQGKPYSVRVSDETYSIIKHSVELSRASNGAFDITALPLIRLWDYKAANFKPPSMQAIASAKLRVGYDKIILGEDNFVGFAQAGMGIDLGGVAKGRAADLCAAAMQRLGASEGIADAGGNMRIFGRSFNIGVRNPRGEGVLCAVQLSDGEGIATSGDYERFVLYNGKRYHHIINPSSGQPARGVASVTVVCQTAEEADAASTALFVLGIEGAKPLLADEPFWAALFIDEEMGMYATENMMSRINSCEGHINTIEF